MPRRFHIRSKRMPLPFWGRPGGGRTLLWRGWGGLLLLLSLAACSPVVEQHLAAASAHSASSRRERDSVVVVIRDSTATRTVRDTVYVERWRTLWRDRTVTRTDTVLRTDTLRSAIVQRVEVPAPRSWWARFVAGVGYAALVAGARDISNRKERKGRKGAALSLRPLRPLRLNKTSPSAVKKNLASLRSKNKPPRRK